MRDPAPARTALLFGYDASRFDGYARQPAPRLRTVEGSLQEACCEVGVFTTPQAARFRTGSRTDRDVSARRNVVVFDSDIPVDRVAAAIGMRVDGLWALGATAVPDDMDPRWAAWREYRYVVGADQVPLDTTPEQLEAALAPFVGRHDFSAFARMEPGRKPEREVYAIRAWRGGPAGPDENGPGVPHGIWSVSVRGRTFLWRQVRRMLAAGLAVVRGEATVAEIQDALVDPSGARDLQAVDGQRLLLWDVHYPDVRFQVHRSQVRRLQDVFAGGAARTAAHAGLYAALAGADWGDVEEFGPSPDP